MIDKIYLQAKLILNSIMKQTCLIQDLSSGELLDQVYDRPIYLSKKKLVQAVLEMREDLTDDEIIERYFWYIPGRRKIWEKIWRLSLPVNDIPF